MLALSLACPALAQVEAPPFFTVEVAQDSGWHANTTSTPRVVLAFTVEHDLAQWTRLYFREVTLAGDVFAGDASVLRLTSHADGDVQLLDARSLGQWGHSSAYFNGGAVEVEVLAHPGTGANRVVVGTADFGLPAPDEPSICGSSDDRVLSSDPRAARLLPVGCTGWLISDCQHCFLTAGHCATSPSSFNVIQFNVPLSSGGGSLNHPPASDQYSLDTSSLQSNGGAGVGNDYAYYGAHPNSNTGLTAFQAQGSAFDLAPPPPVSGNSIRITGYGTDSGSSNQVQQTHVGPFAGNSGTAVSYVTDTTGGNSGSPVIWEQTGQAVGIHTHGGCTSTGGANNGTSYTNSGLQAFLAAPTGVCQAGIDPGSLPAYVPEGQATLLTITVIGTPVAGSVMLQYRLAGGAFTPVPMNSVGGNDYAALLPAAACSDTPELYFSYDDTSCGSVTSPLGAPADVYSIGVGDPVVSWEDDFESDLGWVATSSGATSGFWQRGVPVNDGGWQYDPPSDGDGSGSAYLTQNVAGNTDVDAGSVTLTSPSFDATNAGLEYLYYLYLTDASGTDRLLVEANNNGGSGAWVTIAVHDTNGSTSWRTHTISAGALAAAGVPGTANMRVRFTANDGDPQSIAEAGVDGFRALGIDCGGGAVSEFCYCPLGAPCGNNSLGGGCSNSTGGGAFLTATGTASVAADDLTLTASGLPSNQNGILFMGDTAVVLTFGDGYRCAGGSLYRFSVQNSGAFGSFGQSGIAGYSAVNFPPSGHITAGQTWNFQAWYRDPGGPCGNNFNLSNAVAATFAP